MFLAIAVDNLGNAQEMTARQEEEERIAQELKERCLKSEINMFAGDNPAEKSGDKKDSKKGLVFMLNYRK